MKIGKINKIIQDEIDKYEEGYPGSDYIRALRQVRMLINDAANQEKIKEVLASCDCDMNIKLQERCEDPPFKSLVWDEKNWLYLPDSICYISVKDIKSIAFGTGVNDNTQILFADVYWDLLHSSRYYGRDVQTLEEFVKRGEIDLREG